MRAVTISSNGRISVEKRPDPEPDAGEALVRVHGAGLNRADLLQRAGLYPPPPGVPADIPGLEFAGEVVGLGAGVTRLALGDRVCGITPGAAQAELVVIPERQCARVPTDLDLTHAGGVPEAFITAYDALVTNAGFSSGEHVLVHAVGSGVGTAVVQLVKALGGTVTGTARTASKLQRAAAMGMDHGLLVDNDMDPQAVAQEIVNTGGFVDVVIDLVGGDYVLADIAALAPQGRIVVVGTLAGGRIDLPLLALMAKRGRISGTVLRNRNAEDKELVIREFARHVVPLFDELKLRPVIEAVLPMSKAAKAYDLLASDTTFGKVILKP
ncbi:MAG: NAD(P)H-quinone oxidoreductase [Acidimicrobiia bacterium]